MIVRRLRALASLTVVVALAGCASAGLAWRAGPAGIPAEQKLRVQLVQGQYGLALDALRDKEIRPADALLRHMYMGLVALHAGQWELGTRAMDHAWQIAYQRWTKRLRDGAASLVTGEGALPYYPGPAERMMIPYYGGLNWLARNERDEAAVEARRLSALLASDDGPMPDRRFQGVMRYVAGVMFEVAGERNDAEVAYRNANVLLDGLLPGDTIPPDTAHGDVVVLIEDGFVTRPEPAALRFWLDNDELDILSGDDEERRRSTFDIVDRRRHEQRDWSETSFRLVSLRWPVMDSRAHEPSAGVLGARTWRSDSIGGVIPANTVGMNVSDAIRADFDRKQPARLARAVARAALREASLKGAGDAFEAAGDVLDSDDKGGEGKPKKSGKGKKATDADGSEDGGNGTGKGWLAVVAILLGIGLLAAHASSQVLDQPDLRAWQLLPDQVTVARLRLPVGDHPIEVTRGGEAISLGTVTVRPGSVTVLVHRWWPGDHRVIVAAPAAAAASEPPVAAVVPERR